MRVNVRLDQQIRERLGYIAEHIGVNTSTVVKQAIRLGLGVFWDKTTTWPDGMVPPCLQNLPDALCK